MARKSNRRDLVVTDRLDDQTMRFLESGGRVLLLSLRDLSPVQPGLELGWWPSNNQRGTVFVTHPAFGAFPCAGGMPCLAWFRIFHDAIALDERLGNQVDPLMVTLGKESYPVSVFQARVGSGRLFASGLDLLAGNPEAAYLLDEFLRYVESNRFEPIRNLDPSVLQRLVSGPSSPSQEPPRS